MRDLTYCGLIDLFCNSIDEVVSKRGGSVETTIGKAASEAEIIAFEERLEITFPRDFKNFLKTCDGFQSMILGPKDNVASVCQISGLADIERERESFRTFAGAVESASIEQGDEPVYDSSKAL